MSQISDSGAAESESHPPIRWWPGVLVLVATLAWLLNIHLGEAQDHQKQFLRTIVAVVLGGFGMFLWLVLLSRLPGRIRAGIFLGVVVLGGAVAGLFRIKGVSGNLVPILEPRWVSESAYQEVKGRAAAEISPEDFPQFLGQERNGVVKGVTLHRDWQSLAPKELWRREVGDAWSGFAVVGEAAVTLEQQGEMEVLVRYDLATGEIVWTHGVPATFETVIGGNGPRSTPTIHRGRVYAFGAVGDLRSVDLQSGDLIWHRRLADDYGATVPEWGFASSPLILERPEGDLVVVSIGKPGGQSLVAHDADTGEPVWAGGSDRVGYSSPALVTLADTPQILIFNGASVAAHSTIDGALLWSKEWPGEHPHVAQPQGLPGDRVLVSSGYGHGSKLFEVSKTEATETEPAQWTAEEVWESRALKAKFANFVQFDGKIYGLDDGIMVCVDPATGERCWKRGRFGHGQILLVEDLLLVQTEKGELKLIEPNPEELRELGSIKALSGKSWNTLTLSGNRLLLRNAEEAVCYELPLA